MDYDKAASYWKNQDQKSVKASDEEIRKEVVNFLTSHNTCALGTCHNESVRVTPIEYTFYNNAIWLFSEGGIKFENLKYNNNVCLAVYDNYVGFASIHGMQIDGNVEIIEPWSDTYLDILAYKKIPVTGFKKIDHPMYLLKVCIKEISFLNTDFKKGGYSSRQHLNW